jgi:hypothetical protein
MADILSLKQTTKYVRASELGNLEDYVDRTFIIRKNSAVKAYRLAEVKNNTVYLEYIGDREDKFSLPLNKFRKFYELPQKG